MSRHAVAQWIGLGDGVLTNRPQNGRLAKVIHGLSLGMAAAAALLSVVLMLLGVFDVLLRRLGHSIPGAYEYTEVALVGIAVGGLALAEMDLTHVRTKMLTARLPGAWAYAAKLTGLVVGLVLIVWIVYVSAGRALDAYAAGEKRVGLAAVPQWPARLIIPMGFAAFGLELVLRAIECVQQLASGGQRVEPDEHRPVEPQVAEYEGGAPL